eukprot:1177730-Prorocentrum_minimum.AAC.2
MCNADVPLCRSRFPSATEGGRVTPKGAPHATPSSVWGSEGGSEGGSGNQIDYYDDGKKHLEAEEECEEWYQGAVREYF